jgi:hypothetical protein
MILDKPHKKEYRYKHNMLASNQVVGFGDEYVSEESILGKKINPAGRISWVPTDLSKPLEPAHP